MIKKFLNARSPLRLLEKGLHGGLGAGNVGVVLAGHGVGKTSFLVGVALDDLLRGQQVMHISLDGSVSHIRAYYDTLWDELAQSSHLEDEARNHADVDRLRSIRVYARESFSASKLREAVKLEIEAGNKPAVIVIEGFETGAVPTDDLADIKALAEELEAEVWVSVGCPTEAVGDVPPGVAEAADAVSVILALEPANGSVNLRALKDHGNPNVDDLHVALDPKSLLLIRH